MAGYGPHSKHTKIGNQVYHLVGVLARSGTTHTPIFAKRSTFFFGDAGHGSMETWCCHKPPEKFSMMNSAMVFRLGFIPVGK